MDVLNIPITQIKPYEKNPRKNDAAVDKVVASIREFGFQQPIVVDAKGCIIVGHTRFKAALKMGLQSVPVVYANNLTPQQVKAYRIADNKTNEFAEWDYNLLAEEFSDLAMLGYDMTNTAFGKDEINGILTTEVVEDGFDVDNAVKEIVQPKSKVGDVFLLGQHRVMCGDCTILNNVDILMAGEKADMIFTDPPYNVNYEGGTGLKIQNDSMSDEKFYNFLYDAYISMFSAVKEGGGLYVCHADSEGLNFRKAFKEAGFDLKQCIIWVKNTFVMGRQDHHWQHEPILYGWKPGSSHKWYGGRKQSTVIQPSDGITINKIDNKTTQVTLVVGLQKVVFNVGKYELLDFTDDTGTSIWNVEKPKKNGEHPTMKPLKLCAKAIRNSSLSGDIVLDLFGGSGSTLMACEQLERRCYTMELDPVYVDIIVKRWEEFTGKRAYRVGE